MSLKALTFSAKPASAAPSSPHIDFGKITKDCAAPSTQPVSAHRRLGEYRMNKGIRGTTDDLRNKRFYHGTRGDLRPGDLIEPGNPSDVGELDRMTTHVYLTPNLDEAIWDAELAVGEGPGRVYIVEPTGQIGDASDLTDWKSPGHPSMSCCSREPLQVTGEVTE